MVTLGSSTWWLAFATLATSAYATSSVSASLSVISTASSASTTPSSIVASSISSAATSQSTSNSTASSYNETAILSSGAIVLNDWQNAYDQAYAFVANITNEEKIQLITKSDVTSQNFTALTYLDSTISLFEYYYVSEFPAGLAVAMTWDKDLITKNFKAVGDEHYQAGTQVINGPVGEPLGRSPWGGRTVESFGPDAYLNGIAFGLACQAITNAGVIAGGKHFLLNEQETNRESGGSQPGPQASSSNITDSYSADVDDKALHETYLRPFYDATKGGMGAVMCAMNRVNETYSCETPALLNKFLKTEIGFPGLVYADVSGQKTAFGSANSGMDVGSSQTWSQDVMLEGISNGTLSQDRLDDMAIRSIIGWYYTGLNVADQPEDTGASGWRDIRANHSFLIREVAGASLVLLKNDNTLPLSKPNVISIFGAHAGPAMAGPNFAFSVSGEADTYQGHLTTPGGSGEGSKGYVITPLHALVNKAATDGTMLNWILNDTYTSSGGGMGMMNLGAGSAMTPSIENYASVADVCLVFLNAFSGEGADRGQLSDDTQDELVNSVAGSCNNTVVVLNSVGVRILDAWIENDNVTAVVFGSLLGQESGNAIIDVLYGDVNPSGRLPFTIPKNISDISAFEICEEEVCTFSEGNYIDYKYFDKNDIEPRFEFGFGLSYTTFSYASASVSSSNVSSGYLTGARSVGGRADLWYDAATITVDITNNGTVAGAEVAQLYVSFPDEAEQPVRQLRGFEKVSLEAGASSTATFTLQNRDLAYWDVTAQEWAIAAGEYTLYVGASSRDIRAQTTLTVS